VLPLAARAPFVRSHRIIASSQRVLQLTTSAESRRCYHPLIRATLGLLTMMMIDAAAEDRDERTMTS
jgi:hypothetical protein